MTTNEKTKIERDLKQRVKKNSVGSAPSSISGLKKTSDGSTRSDSAGRILTSSEKTTPLEKFFRSVDKSTQINKSRLATIAEEIAAYGALARKNPSTDAGRFWKQHGSQMPLLKELAQYHLATPGTSVPSESAFSQSAYIARKERSRLTAENLSYTVFLKDKLKRSTV
jgi:hAT family C-terminal dimerisation region